MKRVKKHVDTMERRLDAIEQMLLSWPPNGLSARSVRSKIETLREKIASVRETGFKDKSFLAVPIPQVSGSCIVWNLRKE